MKVLERVEVWACTGEADRQITDVTRETSAMLRTCWILIRTRRAMANPGRILEIHRSFSFIDLQTKTLLNVYT